MIIDETILNVKLEVYCTRQCNNICKHREKQTKENCIIKKFIDQL